MRELPHAEREDYVPESPPGPRYGSDNRRRAAYTDRDPEAAAAARPAGPDLVEGGTFVSIVRVGLSETKKFAEGYDAIFGKKKGAEEKKAEKSDTGKKKKKKSKKKA